MPVEAADMSMAQPFGRLTLVLVGAEKSGKSRLASTARKPILFLDADKRREAIAGKPGVYALSFADAQYPQQPDSYSNMLTVMTMIEQGKTLKDIGAAFGQPNWPAQRIKTIVNDSLTSIGKAAGAYAMYTNKDLRREITIGGGKLYFPNGWDTWNAETTAVEALIMRQLAISDLDVICIFHETYEKDVVASSEKATKYTGKITVYPHRHQGLVKYFNEVWRVSREFNPIPQIQVIPDYRFNTAATNLDFSKIPASEMKPDIEYLINRSLGVTK